MKPLLNILAVDNHLLFLKTISECLDSSPVAKSVDTCTSYADLKRKLHYSVPDLLFLDLNFSPQSCFSICREIKQNYRKVFVAMLGQYNDGEFVEKSRACGAGAFFVKDTEPSVLSRFLNDLREGRIRNFYSPSVPVKDKEKEEKENGVDLKELLSNREREVMQLLVQGTQRNEIQAMLDISYETYKSHRRNLLRKLQVPNEMELLRFAMHNGLMEKEY